MAGLAWHSSDQQVGCGCGVCYRKGYGPAAASKWGGVVGFLHVHGLGGARVALEEVVGSGWLWELVEVFAADPALLWSSGHGGL